MNDGAFTSRFVDLSEVRLHVVECGPEDGPLVVLLHGFPEFWGTWRAQLTALASAGFRAVAPDLRGYNLSDKPTEVDAYRVERLVGDVTDLIASLGAERAHVVGHDWGGVVAWWTAMLAPAHVERLAIVNAAHPVAYGEAIRRPPQLFLSWYVFAFQVPWVPEWWISRELFGQMRALFREDGLPEEEIDEYVQAMSQEGALSAAIAYYRSTFRDSMLGRSPEPRKIELPTLVLWGERDRYLAPELAEPPAEWVQNARVVRLPEASHWAQRDAADAVSRELVSFFDLERQSGEHRARASSSQRRAAP